MTTGVMRADITHLTQEINFQPPSVEIDGEQMGRAFKIGVQCAMAEPGHGPDKENLQERTVSE